MLRKILEKQGIDQTQIDNIFNAMKAEGVHTTSIENADVRYSKLKEKNEQSEGKLKEYMDQVKILEESVKGSEELKGKFDTMKSDYEARIKDMTINSAMSEVLNSAKSVDNDVLKALIDLSNINYQEGDVEGLKGQIMSQVDALKESKSFLFEAEKPNIPQNTGGVGNHGRGSAASSITKDQFNSMSYMERLELRNSNPTLYNQLNN